MKIDLSNPIIFHINLSLEDIDFKDQRNLNFFCLKIIKKKIISNPAFKGLEIWINADQIILRKIKRKKGKK